MNNQEMGIYVAKADDAQLYDEIYNEVRWLMRLSDEVRLSVEKIVEPEKAIIAKVEGNKTEISEKGFCIRCKKRIVLNPSAPYCVDCYKSWKQCENSAYQEKFCYLCGKNNSSTMNKPVCIDCYKQRKELFVARS